MYISSLDLLLCLTERRNMEEYTACHSVVCQHLFHSNLVYKWRMNLYSGAVHSLKNIECTLLTFFIFEGLMQLKIKMANMIGIMIFVFC